MGTKDKNPRRFLTDQIAHYKGLAAKDNVPFDINLDYLETIWNGQNGRCAITGVEMTHGHRDLFAVRLDIKDPSKGFVKENVQLICDGVKKIKKNATNEEVTNFIDTIKSIIKL